jgi:hypothetical protein
LIRSRRRCPAEAAFRENDVSAEDLCHFTADDLKERDVAGVGSCSPRSTVGSQAGLPGPSQFQSMQPASNLHSGKAKMLGRIKGDPEGAVRL